MSGVVVITGSSRGIGAATALLFAKNGFDVCVNFLSNEQAAARIKFKIESYGVKCLLVKGDVSQPNVVEHMFEQTLEHLGTPSVLVNNTGILDKQSRLEDISTERFQHIMMTNVMSTFLCAQKAIKLMSTKHNGNGGAIINVSSKASVTGSPNEYVDYAASKGAIDSMTVGLAKEVADEGIRVNAVRPGLIETDIHELGGEPDRVERLKHKIPMARGGQSDEVAEAIFWLASDKSSFTTATLLDVTGGL